MTHAPGLICSICMEILAEFRSRGLVGFNLSFTGIFFDFVVLYRFKGYFYVFYGMTLDVHV
jgi:hypothetical protein